MMFTTASFTYFQASEYTSGPALKIVSVFHEGLGSQQCVLWYGLSWFQKWFMNSMLFQPAIDVIRNIAVRENSIS